MFWSSHAKTCTEKLTYVCKELISATKDVKLELVLFPFHFWIWYETPSFFYLPGVSGWSTPAAARVGRFGGSEHQQLVCRLLCVE